MRSEPPCVGSSSTSKSDQAVRRQISPPTVSRRKIRKMLVVNRVKLIFLHQTQQVREFHSDYTPFGFSRIFMPATKLLRSGTCARTLLPRSKSARFPWRG